MFVFGLLFRYIRYLLKSVNQHSIHSPFVFKFYLSALRNQKQLLDPAIESHRLLLKRDHREIPLLSLGAPSKVEKNNSTLVSKLAHSSLKPPKQVNLLINILNYFSPTTVVELGTSLGITSAYFAKYAKEHIYTLEGNEKIALVANEYFRKQNFDNIKLVIGNIDTTLRETLTSLAGKLDFVYIDANHTYEATLRYVNDLHPFCHNDTVIVLDDIHWSSEMEEAWKEVIKDTRFHLTIDVYHFGLVFIRKEQAKEHFVLRTFL